MNMRRCAMVLLVLTSMLVARPALASSEYIRCAVKSTGNASVIVGFASANDQVFVQADAASCIDPAAGVAPASATATTESHTARDAIATINAGPHGTLPPPTASAGCSGAQARMDVQNSTSYTLTLYLDGPTARVLSISSGSSTTVQIPTGQYSVGGTVQSANVTPLSGTWNLGNCASYSTRFYIQ